MVETLFVSGKILLSDGFQNGFIRITNEKQVSIGKGKPPTSSFKKGIIIPTFINAHTHIGDAFVRRRDIDLPHDLEKLVAPPDGLKHRLLQQVTEEELHKGIALGLQEMIDCGTCCFCDFREEGSKGVKSLTDQTQKKAITPMIFGRPNQLSYDKNELLKLFSMVDGLGISSVSDWESDELESVIYLARKHDIAVAFHASERIRENIDLILSMDPAFLVHMTKASKNDFEKVKQRDVPVVICPRSNAFFGQKPPFDLMKETGIDLLLGTDNAMLHSLCVLDEIRFILTQFPNMFSLEQLFSMTTYGPRKALNLKDGIPGSTFPTSFVVLDPVSLKPIFTSLNG